MKLKRKTFNKIKKYSIITFVVALVVVIFYSIFFTQFIRIYYFDIDYPNENYKSVVSNQLQNTLNEKLLWFIPKNNLLTYSGKEIKNITKSIITNTQTISVYPENLHTIKIKISEYTPAFRLDNNGKALSNEGIIYNELNDISNLPLFILSTSTATTTLTNFNKDYINNILDLKDKTDRVLFKTDEIDVNEFNDISFLNKELNQKIIFKKDSDLKKIWSTLISAIDTDPLKQKISQLSTSSYYIDLRIGNKVFYKWTNQNTKDIIVSSSTQIKNETATSTGILAKPSR